MPTKRQHEAMTLYADLMEEAKVRLKSIETAVAGDMNIPTSLAHEYSYLQLRMLCELIALGCLVAHGDIKEVQDKRFQDEYHAARIMAGLERLHSGFYPQPAKQIYGNGVHELRAFHTGFLTKPELFSLYGRSGEFLHRGRMKGLVRNHSPLSLTLPRSLSGEKRSTNSSQPTCFSYSIKRPRFFAFYEIRSTSVERRSLSPSPLMRAILSARRESNIPYHPS
jgi:hypothetical protein